MADALYDLGREKFLKGEIDWVDDDIKCVLVDSADYTRDLAADEFLSDISAGARVGTSGNLANKTATGGVADADDVTVSSVTGDQFEYVVIYKDTGDAATSPLIACIDSATGLAFTPSGGDILIQWAASGNKIFKL